MARAFGQEAACGVLEQYTTQDTKTELTEVSQQLCRCFYNNNIIIINFVNQPLE